MGCGCGGRSYSRGRMPTMAPSAQRRSVQAIASQSMSKPVEGASQPRQPPPNVVKALSLKTPVRRIV